MTHAQENELVDAGLRHVRRSAYGIATRLGGALLLAAFFVGCGASSSDEGALPMLTGDGPASVRSRGDVELDIRPEVPIRVGKNTLRVSFPVRGADLVGVSAFMAAHGHGSPPPAIERDGETFVVRDLVLFMSGRWELRLVLQVDPGGGDEAVVAVDVP